MKRVAIIGGGIAGLSAAYFLERSKRDDAGLEWTLFEKSDRPGGVIRTEQRDGYVLEAGPDSFLTIKPDGAQLCRDLGIGGELISSNDSERKTYILVKGRLIAIPDGLQFMVPTRVWPIVTTPLFSFGTKLRMAAELLTRAGTRADESVGDFVRRHFGEQMVDRVAEPLLAGVYGGNADHLSVQAVLPRFVEMERQTGSLARATLRARKRAAAQQNGAQAQPLFTSLKSGMQQMVDTLLAAIPRERLKLCQPVLSLKRLGGDWQLETPEGGARFDIVLLAVPAQASAALLKPVHAELAANLARITYTSSVAVALAYDKLELPAGHGFLIPSREDRKMMACTFVHKKFPYRVPDGGMLLRCFFSSARMPDLLNYDDATLESIARDELKLVLGLTSQPHFARVFRWDCALPQYETGHLKRVAQMERWIAGLPGLEIIGNSFHGIGVPDCIRSARLAVCKINSPALQPASA
jgi:oxygen-dependent protoporphyrinogen oxidase